MLCHGAKQEVMIADWPVIGSRRQDSNDCGSYGTHARSHARWGAQCYGTHARSHARWGGAYSCTYHLLDPRY
jgi:hypothetical protein